MKKLRICFAGNSGHSGTVFASYDRISDRVEICGYSTTYDGEKTEDIERHLKNNGIVCKKYDDYKVMCEEQNPDILVIDGRFCDHAKMSMYALSHGYHVYCDKPSATEEDEFDEVKKAVCEAKKQGIQYMTMNTARYDVPFYTAKQLVDKGVIGKVTMINAQKSYRLGKRAEFYKTRKTYGGTIPWILVHGLDLILWICNCDVKEVYSVQNIGNNYDHGEMEMSAISVLKMNDGTVAHVNADFLRPKTAPTHGDDRVRIAGDKGVIEVRDNNVYVIDETGSYVAENVDYGYKIFEDFVLSIIDNKPTLFGEGDCLRITHTALMARKSAETNETVKF